jgi:hypothetical protein
MPSLPEIKIPEEDLRKIAATTSSERISVLIQPDVSERKIKFVPRETNISDRNRRRPIRVEPETPEEVAKNERIIDATKELVRQVTGSSPMWLSAARAFVANVTPSELNAIIASPLIKSVWLNRQYTLSKDHTVHYAQPRPSTFKQQGPAGHSK